MPALQNREDPTMTKTERAFRAGYRMAVAHRLDGMCAPELEWGWWEWAGVAAVVAGAAWFGWGMV